jgi:hypothetical protein
LRAAREYSGGCPYPARHPPCALPLQGRMALDAVQLIADLVRMRKCCCPPEVVRTLLVLRFTEVRAPVGADAAKGRGGPGKGKSKGKKRKGDEVDLAFKEAEAGEGCCMGMSTCVTSAAPCLLHVLAAAWVV